MNCDSSSGLVDKFIMNNFQNTMNPAISCSGLQLPVLVNEVPSPYNSVFSQYESFNPIQSNVFHDVLYSDNSLAVSAPTGSGKTVIFELAIIKLLMNEDSTKKFKIIYIAPMKALCEERLVDWHNKFKDFGVNCISVTGDSENVDIQSLMRHQLIITTPEKWDVVTRRWRDNDNLVKSIKLFLVDEIHLVNDETRGATLEAIITRMKTVSNFGGFESQPLRFIGVSATVSNIIDIAQWFDSPQSPGKHYQFKDDTRPIKLQKIVIGYPYNPATSSPFKFDIMLGYKLHQIVLQYSCGKPTLVFCSTRKSAEMTSKQLVQNLTISLNNDQKRILVEAANNINNPKVTEVLVHGVGCHHAGMLPDHRRLIENLFKDGYLPVLITTSTLSMGVNLPAHLVVVKWTKYYVNGEYKSYEESMIFQMIGRAGRPQFDTSGTAVIMTTTAEKHKYENMISGEQPIESYLRKHLVEFINAEAVLQTITDISVAMQWLSSTFLYIRARKNPRHYGLPLGLSLEDLDKKLIAMCQIEVNKLCRAGMLTIDTNASIFPTETGRLMAKYCVSFETMKLFTEMTGNEQLHQVLELISKCYEFQEIRLRSADKSALNILNKCKNKQTIRFPLSGRIRTVDMKINCIIQAVLGCLEIRESGLLVEAQRIMRIGERLLSCLTEYLKTKKKCYLAILSTITLCKCFRARIWENSIHVARQLDGIGSTLSNALVAAGKTSFQIILEANPRDLERILNRKPPFGNTIQDQVKLIPKYSMNTSKIEDGACGIITIVITMENASNFDHNMTVNPSAFMHLIVGGEDNLLLHKKFSHLNMAQLVNIVENVEVSSAGLEIEVGISWISEDWAGIDVSSKIILFEDKTKNTQNLSQDLILKQSEKNKRSSKPNGKVIGITKKKSKFLQQSMDKYFGNVKSVKRKRSDSKMKQAEKEKLKNSMMTSVDDTNPKNKEDTDELNDLVLPTQIENEIYIRNQLKNHNNNLQIQNNIHAKNNQKQNLLQAQNYIQSEGQNKNQIQNMNQVQNKNQTQIKNQIPIKNQIQNKNQIENNVQDENLRNLLEDEFYNQIENKNQTQNENQTQNLEDENLRDHTQSEFEDHIFDEFDGYNLIQSKDQAQNRFQDQNQTLNQLKNKIHDQIQNKNQAQTSFQDQNQIRNQLKNKFHDQIPNKNQAQNNFQDENLRNQLEDEFYNQIQNKDQIDNGFEDVNQVGNQLQIEFFNQIQNQKQLQNKNHVQNSFEGQNLRNQFQNECYNQIQNQVQNKNQAQSSFEDQNLRNQFQNEFYNQIQKQNQVKAQNQVENQLQNKNRDQNSFEDQNLRNHLGNQVQNQLQNEYQGQNSFEDQNLRNQFQSDFYNQLQKQNQVLAQNQVENQFQNKNQAQNSFDGQNLRNQLGNRFYNQNQVQKQNDVENQNYNHVQNQNQAQKLNQIQSSELKVEEGNISEDVRKKFNNNCIASYIKCLNKKVLSEKLKEGNFSDKTEEISSNINPGLKAKTETVLKSIENNKINSNFQINLNNQKQQRLVNPISRIKKEMIAKRKDYFDSTKTMEFEASLLNLSQFSKENKKKLIPERKELESQKNITWKSPLVESTTLKYSPRVENPPKPTLDLIRRKFQPHIKGNIQSYSLADKNWDANFKKCEEVVSKSLLELLFNEEKIEKPSEIDLNATISSNASIPKSVKTTFVDSVSSYTSMNVNSMTNKIKSAIPKINKEINEEKKEKERKEKEIETIKENELLNKEKSLEDFFENVDIDQFFVDFEQDKNKTNDKNKKEEELKFKKFKELEDAIVKSSDFQLDPKPSQNYQNYLKHKTNKRKPFLFGHQERLSPSNCAGFSVLNQSDNEIHLRDVQRENKSHNNQKLIKQNEFIFDKEEKVSLNDTQLSLLSEPQQLEKRKIAQEEFSVNNYGLHKNPITFDFIEEDFEQNLPQKRRSCFRKSSNLINQPIVSYNQPNTLTPMDHLREYEEGRAFGNVYHNQRQFTYQNDYDLGRRYPPVEYNRPYYSQNNYYHSRYEPYKQHPSSNPSYQTQIYHERFVPENHRNFQNEDVRERRRYYENPPQRHQYHQSRSYFEEYPMDFQRTRHSYGFRNERIQNPRINPFETSFENKEDLDFVLSFEPNYEERSNFSDHRMDFVEGRNLQHGRNDNQYLMRRFMESQSGGDDFDRCIHNKYDRFQESFP